MSVELSTIEDYCQDLKCVAGRLFKQAVVEIKDGHEARGKLYHNWANRVDDAREAIVAAANNLERAASQQDPVDPLGERMTGPPHIAGSRAEEMALKGCKGVPPKDEED